MSSTQVNNWNIECSYGPEDGGPEGKTIVVALLTDDQITDIESTYGDLEVLVNGEWVASNYLSRSDNGSSYTEVYIPDAAVDWMYDNGIKTVEVRNLTITSEANW